MEAIVNEPFQVGERKFIAKPHKDMSCTDCVAEHDECLCSVLPSCAYYERADQINVIFIKVRP